MGAGLGGIFSNNFFRYSEKVTEGTLIKFTDTVK